MKKVLGLLVLGVMVFSGCATLLKSKTAMVNFNSYPDKRDVYINGENMGTTPLELELSHKKAVTVKFVKDGYRSRTYTIKRRVDPPWVVLDVLIGVGPVLVDAATGNWFSLETTEFNGYLDVGEEVE